MSKIDKNKLPYKNTKPCEHIECSDLLELGINTAIVHTELLGFLCSDHGMLALIAGLKPTPLPEAPEGLRLMMESQ